MTKIETRVTTEKWATFKESDIRKLIAESLGINVEEISSLHWPLNPLVSTYYPGNKPLEKEVKVYLR